MGSAVERIEAGQVWVRMGHHGATSGEVGERVEIEEGPFDVTAGLPGHGNGKIEQVRARHLSGPREGEPVQWATSYLRLNFNLIDGNGDSDG